MTAAKPPTVDALAKLREPFPAPMIEKLPRIWCKDCRDAKPSKVCGNHQRAKCGECHNNMTVAHLHLDYVGHAGVTERLLDADPEWTWEPVAFDERGLPAVDRNGNGAPVGLWIKLTVCGVTRYGYGSCDPKPDAVKELIGDALRNAAMRFGVALDLWAKWDRDAVEAAKDSPAGAEGAAESGIGNGPTRQTGSVAPRASEAEISPQETSASSAPTQRGGAEEPTTPATAPAASAQPTTVRGAVVLEAKRTHFLRLCESRGLVAEDEIGGVVNEASREELEAAIQRIQMLPEKASA